MIESGKTYVVMGLLDAESIAYAIGRAIEGFGGQVVYTVQNERMKRIFLDGSRNAMSEEERESLNIRFCDVTKPDEVQALFAELNDVAGVVHSIAFANPKTCLGEEFHTDAVEDVMLSHHISCVSLATVARFAQPAMQNGGAIVALSFDSAHVFPFYNWMGVQKSALEALVRALARRHGRDLVRVNAVSAGPLATKAASKIPGFGQMTQVWDRTSPLPWDCKEAKADVAQAAVFLLGRYSRKITGQVLMVDGGASIIRGHLMDFERPDA